MPKQKPKSKPKTKEPDLGAEGLQGPGVDTEDLQEPDLGAESLHEPGVDAEDIQEPDLGAEGLQVYVRLKYGIEYLKLQYFGRSLFKNLSRAYKAWSLDQTIVLDPVFKNIEKLDQLKDIEKFESVMFPEIERFLASAKKKK